MLIVPPPNIPSLFRQVSDDETALKMSGLFGNQAFSCRQVRGGELFGTAFCPRISNSPKVDLRILEQEYLGMVKIMEAMAAKFESVGIAADITNHVISPKDMASDCFHPSEEGHRKIASISRVFSKKLLSQSP